MRYRHHPARRQEDVELRPATGDRSLAGGHDDRRGHEGRNADAGRRTPCLAVVAAELAAGRSPRGQTRSTYRLN